MNTFFKLTDSEQIDKHSEIAAYVKAWVDEEYADGRVTVVTDEEMLEVIESAIRENGIHAEGIDRYFSTLSK